jgi:ABC-type uncharacterized transport system fused permease/ATPase subunit
MDITVVEKVEKLKNEGVKLRREVRERTVGYVVAALGIVAGLAWNDAVKSVIEYIFPLSQNTLWAKLVYAVIVTLIVVIITTYLVRIAGKDGDGTK